MGNFQKYAPGIRLFLWILLIVISVVLLVSANPFRSGAGQPHVVKIGKENKATLVLHLRYASWQNPSVVIEPDNLGNGFSGGDLQKACILHIWVRQAGAGETPQMLESVNKEPFCNAKVFDLSQVLHPQGNQLVLDIQFINPQSAQDSKAIIYVNSQLFGSHMLSTLACLGLFGAAAILLFTVMKRAGLNTTTSVIAIAGMAYYALCLHVRPNLEYTPDFPGHRDYTLYMARSLLINPYEYAGHECMHAPFYYFIAARIFNFFATGVISPLSAVRIFSLGLYMIFCVYSLRTLFEAVEKKGLPYYIGCFLIMFWPVAVNTASNFSDDIASYSVWAAEFYYLARWHRERCLSSLQLAIGLTGLAFVVKGNALVIVAFTGSCILYSFYKGQLSLRQLWRGKSLIAVAVFMLGFVVNMGRVIYMQLFRNRSELLAYFGYQRNDIYPFSYFVHFNLKDFISSPFARFGEEPDFLNYFLKTLLYSPFNALHPPFPWLPGGLNLLLVVFLVLTIAGTVLGIVRNRGYWNELYAFIVAVLWAFAGVVGYTVVERYQHCQSIRYAFPAIVPLVILFVRGMEDVRTGRTWPFYIIFAVVGLTLPAGAIALYAVQHP